MKIYLNTDGKGPGGPQRWAARFIRELRQRGFEVTHDFNTDFDAAYLNISGAGAEELLRRKIPFAYRVAGCYIPEWFSAMEKEMLEEHHRQNESIRETIDAAPVVIYQSLWSKSQIDRLFHERKHSFAIIYNGVSGALFRPQISQNAEPVIATGGNLRYRFRLWTLFEVAKRLGASHSLFIAGPLDVESRQVLDENLANPEIRPRIRYVGDISEDRWVAMLQDCAILFHPVCGDSCPNVVAEALMSGLPAIVPRFGGAAELTGEGGAIFECEPWQYFNPAFVENAADVCRRVLNDLPRYRDQARRRAEQRLTLEKMTDHYLEALDLPKRPRGRAFLPRRIGSRLRGLVNKHAGSPEPQRLGYSFVDLAFGGAQVFFVHLIECLARRGYEINYHLFADVENPTLCDERLFDRINRVAGRVTLEELLRCDTIHLDGYHTPEQKEIFLPRFSKCIETYHSEYSVRTSGPFFAPHRVAVSEAIRKMVPPVCELIFHGIDTEVFASDSSQKEYDIAILGRIHPAKNHLLFLDVCALLARTRPLNALIIGGYPANGEYESRVKKRITELESNGARIEVTGFCDNEDVPRYLNRCRLLLVTSPSEGFGRMAAEALACEVPVVANSIGGLVEIVRHGHNGFTVKSGTPEEFAELSSLLLRDSALREHMGHQGRNDVVQKFSVGRMVEEYEQVYRKIQEQNKSRNFLLE